MLLTIKIHTTTYVRQTDRRYESGPLRKGNSSLKDDRLQVLTHINLLVNRLKKKPVHWGHSNRPRKKVYCKNIFFINKKMQDKTYHTMVWSWQPKQNRQDTDSLQCQSTTKRNNPHWQTISWNWPPREFLSLGNLILFLQGAIAIQGNIEAIFKQIGVRQQDRGCLRLIPNSPELEVYEHKGTYFWI